MKCAEEFNRIYLQEPQAVAFCPYRVSPIGAHSDHQSGKITGFSLNKGVYIAYRRETNGEIELCSLNFEKRVRFHVCKIPKERQNDWADHLRGAALILGEKYKIKNGITGLIAGDLPIGGLSSSSAVIIAFLIALGHVNGIALKPEELVDFTQNAENKYVGISSGKFDPYCEVYGKKDRLLCLDVQDGSHALIPRNPNMPEFEVAIFFSGLERTLVGSAYNMRVDECKAAAYALLAYSGREYEKFFDARLRDVPYADFERHKGKLPINWRKRAEHFYTEFARVEQGIAAWKNGDLAQFGQCCFDSCLSSIKNYETGCAELIALFHIMRKTDGIYGGRFSGFGFRGSCMALSDPSFRETINQSVTQEYLKQFPEQRGKFSVHFCQSADGIRFAQETVGSYFRSGI